MLASDPERRNRRRSGREERGRSVSREQEEEGPGGE
jgi:hypothetical protein